MSRLIFDDVSYSYPDGTKILSEASFKSDSLRTALVGVNGAGKSTVLKLIQKSIFPQSGHIVFDCKAFYLPQETSQLKDIDVIDVLDVREKLQALTKAECGQASENDILKIGDDWNLRERLKEVLNEYSLNDDILNLKAGHVSGGELIKIFFAKMSIHSFDFIVMDEPSNNLDSKGKECLFRIIEKWHKGLFVVSHDREILNKVDKIIEISNYKTHSYGGNYEFYKNEKERIQSALKDDYQASLQSLKRSTLERQKTQERLLKRKSHDKLKQNNKGIPKIALGTLKMHSQMSQGKSLDKVKNKEFSARVKLEEAKMKLPSKINIVFETLKPNLFNSKSLLEINNVNFSYDKKPLWKKSINLSIVGPERVLVKGENASGKSTLLNIIAQNLKPTHGEVILKTNNLIYLNQILESLPQNISLLDYAMKYAFNSKKTMNDVRIALGRAGFYGEHMLKGAQTLSGGERLRFVLACLILKCNHPDLIILDEPTNNLDLESIEVLERFLNSLHAGIILVSHDTYFTSQLVITKELQLSR